MSTCKFRHVVTFGHSLIQSQRLSVSRESIKLIVLGNKVFLTAGGLVFEK